MRHTVPLASGTLSLTVERADLPLDDLLGFASRRSRKRGFVFVSKVLGKHFPARPSVMADTHARLAAKLADSRLPGPVVLIALAEMATGLGQGVFEELLALTGRDDLLFLTTTRYQLGRPLAFPFEESPSHATRHLVYLPARPEDVRLFRAARSLVLLDDEISTGRTLANLANAGRRIQTDRESVHLVCLTDWLGDAGRERLRGEMGGRVDFHHLLSGTFTFDPAPDFDPGPVPAVDGKGEDKTPILLDPGPRLGVREALPEGYLQVSDPLPSGRILVLGTGEFAHAPYRLARSLERQGHDISFQSSTRSPLLVGGALGSVLAFRDNYHDDIPNYLYNVTPGQYDHVRIGYETSPLPANHRLPELLGGVPCFPDGGPSGHARGRLR